MAVSKRPPAARTLSAEAVKRHSVPIEPESYLEQATQLVQSDPDVLKVERESARHPYDDTESMAEVCTLYGYATLFATACPWAPPLALASCLLQCFLDHKKLVFLSQRPLPLPAADNEPWDTAFEVLSGVAILTNVGITIFTSTAFGSWKMSSRLLCFILLEHLAILIRWLAALFWPGGADRTEWLILEHQQAKLARERGWCGEQEAEAPPEPEESNRAAGQPLPDTHSSPQEREERL